MNLWLIPVGLLALLMAVLAWEALGLLRAQGPRQPRPAQQVGRAPATTADIPRILWTYWDAPTLPPLIEACLANWRRQAPDHELRLLSRANLTDWIAPERLARIDFDRLPAFRQADWIRVELLARHGGIWMDASTVLTAPLDWLHAARAAHHAEYAGYYLERYTQQADLPVVENWLMAAAPGSPLMADLAERFTHYLQQDESACRRDLTAQGRLERVAQGIPDDLRDYLLMHLCLGALLDEHPDRYRLALLPAEDSAFALHRALRWRKRHLYVKLAWCPVPTRMPVLVKLRGPERRICERSLARWGHARFSVLGRFVF